MKRQARRKALKAKITASVKAKLLDKVKACRAMHVDAIVKANLNRPIERNFYASIKSSVVLISQTLNGFVRP